MGDTAEEIEAEIRSTFAASSDPVPMEGISTGNEFRDFNNNPEGIRSPHAVDALAAVAAEGSLERFDLGPDGAWIALALSPVTIGKPYTMLLYVVGRPNAAPEISAAWRLYDLAPDTTPASAFAWFVATHGHQFSVVDVKSRFIAKKITKPDQPGPGFSGPEGTEFRWSAMGYRHANGDMEWSWCFAIDPQRYAAYVRSHR